ncbi:MAG: hypothetical protein V7609_2919 [Verrucomicrobiota bacterium]
MNSISTATRPLAARDRQILDENSEDRAKCQIVTSEEFLREPSRVLGTATTGRQVCIRTPNAEIVVGYTQRLSHCDERWGLWQKLQFRLRRVFRPANGPLDVSWLE